MQIQIMSFGQIAEVTGTNRFSLNAVDTNGLRKVLEDTYPSLQQKTYAIVINRKLVTENTRLTQDAEVALLPPFSGG